MALDDNLLQKIIAPRVLVIGDIMLDRYWFGAVDRISPEAPVPVVLVNECQQRMGGAGNVALNIRCLGANCTLLGIVGDDDAGKALSTIAAEHGVAAAFVTDRSAPTSIKQRIVGRNQQLLRADFEGKPEAASVAKLAQQMQQFIDSHDIVVLSDYGKGALATVEKMIAIANQAQIPVLVDPKGVDFSRYRGASLVTPNLNEFELVVGAISDDNAMAVAANAMIKRDNIERVLVTLSARGMRLFNRDGSDHYSPARSREVYDVSGAGDTVIAMLAMCMGAKLTPTAALQIANSAAGVVISKFGTATATMHELKQAMRRDFGDN